MHNTIFPGVFTEEHARRLELLREPFTIALSNCLRYRQLEEAKDLIEEKYRTCRNDHGNGAFERIIGASSGLKEVMESAFQVARLDSPVVILGETGTGKEMIAECIHELSPRHCGPLIKVNCGAIPESLIDIHLFGHEKGAFTGAVNQRKGCFESADGGTIFLDEVGELPLDAQVRLLRVLQEKKIQRVGGGELISLDIRVIAATNRDLESMVVEGSFRKDLFFRLNVFPVYIPPVRERKMDLPILVHHLIIKKQAEIKLAERPVLAPGAIDRITAYDWPGNVRELANTVEREMIIHNGRPLAFNNLRSSPGTTAAKANESASNPSLKLDEVMTRHIEMVLDMTNGRVHGEYGAAKLLDINPAT